MYICFFHFIVFKFFTQYLLQLSFLSVEGAEAVQDFST